MDKGFTVNDFCLHFSQNAENLMWFIGAGASRSARIKTAWDVTWDLKCRLYCLEQNLDLHKYQEYSSPAIRESVQGYFDSKLNYPKEGDVEEYSFYFEKYFKGNASSQRRYIDEIVKRSDVKPSYGHLFLGLLLKHKFGQVIWTTNFDGLVEDGHAQVGGRPSDLIVAHLDSPTPVIPALNDRRFPLYVKLHGDFRYDTLKNTSEELRTQNAEFSHALNIACNQYGMLVVGYSGRDDSVMEQLHAALDKQNPFPHGLFWFSRPDTPPLSAVTRLIAAAQDKGVQAHLVELGTFDELASRLRKHFLKIDPSEFKAHLDKEPPKATVVAAVPGQNFPAVRTNALPVLETPSELFEIAAPSVVTKSDLKAQLGGSAANIVASIRSGNVIAFGSKDEIENTFSGVAQRLPLGLNSEGATDEGALKSVVGEALVRAIVEGRPLTYSRRGSSFVVRPDPLKLNDSLFSSLKQHVGGSLAGSVPKTKISWSEGVDLKLETKMGQLWLLLTPTVYFGEGDRAREGFLAEKDKIPEFSKNRTKMRRNYEIARLLAAWNAILFGAVEEATLTFGPIGTGGARFKVGTKFAVAGRA